MFTIKKSCNLQKKEISIGVQLMLDNFSLGVDEQYKHLQEYKQIWQFSSCFAPPDLLANGTVFGHG